MKKISNLVNNFLARASRSQPKNLVLRLELLGKYEALLSVSITASEDARRNGQYDEEGFQKQVGQMLKHLCSLGTPFWFKSACLWLTVLHQDRGRLLLPGPRFHFDKANKYREGIELYSALPGVSDIPGVSEPVLLPSTKDQPIPDSFLPEADHSLDVPAAFIPVQNRETMIGLLAVYGVEGGSPPAPSDLAFLSSLSSIIANTMEQWELRFQSMVMREMDELFKCNSLEQVCSQAVLILQKYLSAAGCMLLYRPEPSGAEMEIAAQVGFNRNIYKSRYHVGVGQTGRCVATGSSVRVDDVSVHRDEFDSSMLHTLEKALGSPVDPWMSIPIGPTKENYGAIKVINRTSHREWFTDKEQHLGESLALRLQVIIEKFIYIDNMERAIMEARRQTESALAEKRKAEMAARRRQDDLMVITHQLQGPLSSAIGAISSLKYKLEHQPPKSIQKRLDYIQALIDDSLILCFGTFSTFGREAGRETFFGTANIDAPTELKNLCERLQSTNARPDLTFKFVVEVGFPVLRIDGRVFISVFYSLIHNAMKYAELHSTVILECGFERATGEAALKVKSIGEPILPSEKERIFEKYQRGNVIEKTGRHHSGVGLGLWVARQLMRAVGGDLTVELSSGDPRLSVFVVHVPQTVKRS